MVELLRPETIELNAPGRPKVEALRQGALATHRTLSDCRRWTVTHLPSGLHFGFYWSSEARASAAMGALNKLRQDWQGLKAWQIEAAQAEIWPVLTRSGGKRFLYVPRGVSSPDSFNGGRSG